MGSVKNNLLFAKASLFIFSAFLILIISDYFIRYLESFLTSVLAVLAIFISTAAVFVTYFGSQRDSHNKQVKEQIKIIEGLLAELDVLDSFNKEIYGGEATKGNINWYGELVESGKDYFGVLDHKINSIHIDSYIIKLDSGLCQDLEIGNLVRTLSNINDKISELNYYIFEYVDNRKEEDKKKIPKYQYLHPTLSGVIREVLPKIRILREVLKIQKKTLSRNLL